MGSRHDLAWHTAQALLEKRLRLPAPHGGRGASTEPRKSIALSVSKELQSSLMSLVYSQQITKLFERKVTCSVFLSFLSKQTNRPIFLMPFTIRRDSGVRIPPSPQPQASGYQEGQLTLGSPFLCHSRPSPPSPARPRPLSLQQRDTPSRASLEVAQGEQPSGTGASSSRRCLCISAPCFQGVSWGVSQECVQAVYPGVYPGVCPGGVLRRYIPGCIPGCVPGVC